MKLQPLFAAEIGYECDAYSRFNINHAGLHFMSLELRKPRPDIPHGHFSAFWPTVISDTEGKNALAESYGRLRNKFEFPPESEKLLERYRGVYGYNVELELIIGKETVSSPITDSLDGGILTMGVTMGSNVNRMVREIAESSEIPSDFYFLRFDNPYCAHYFGRHEFSRGTKKVGLLAHVNLSHEIAELLKATGYHKIPEEHYAALIAKLDEILWRLPKLDGVKEVNHKP